MSGRRLIRQIKAGESLSFDGGRLVLTLRHRTGSSAELSMHLQDDVVVDKPTHARGDAGCQRRAVSTRHSVGT